MGSSFSVPVTVPVIDDNPSLLVGLDTWDSKFELRVKILHVEHPLSQEIGKIERIMKIHISGSLVPAQLSDSMRVMYFHVESIQFNTVSEWKPTFSGRLNLAQCRNLQSKHKWQRCGLLSTPDEAKQLELDAPKSFLYVCLVIEFHRLYRIETLTNVLNYSLVQDRGSSQ